MKLLTNLATLGVMSLPVWIVVVALTRPELGSVTVRVAEPDVRVVVGDKAYVPEALQVGPLALEPGMYTLRVLRSEKVLYRESFVLAAGTDKVVSAVWDPAETATVVTRPEREFGAGPAPIHSVAFSPDGRLALSAGGDRTIRIWDVQTGSELRWLEGHLLEVSQAMFTPDGRRILSGSKDGSVRLWDASSGREVRRFSGLRPIHCVAVSADGRRLIAAGDDQRVHCWDAEAGTPLGSFAAQVETIGSLSLSADGRRLLAGYLGAPGEVNPVCLLDLDTGRPALRFEGHRLPVWSVALAANGRHALSGSSDRTVRLWDLADGRELRRFDTGEGVALCVAFSPDGQFVLAGTGPRWRDGWLTAGRYSVRLWDAATGRLLREFQHEGPVRSLAVAADGRHFLSGGEEGVMRLWSLDPEAVTADGKAKDAVRQDPALGPLQALPFPQPAQF